MNTRIAISGLSIVASLALVTTGAYAMFSSSASNNGNTFGSGTLTLKINGQTPTSTNVFSVTGAAPGSTSSTQNLQLQNTGTVAAASSKLTGITVTPLSSPNLGDVVTLELWKDSNDDGIINGSDTLIKSAHLTDGSWTNLDLGSPLPALGHQNILARLTFDSGANDTYQNGNVSFDLGFQANQ